MHALITGGAGFIGTALVERLLAGGHTVDVVDNLSSGSLSNLADSRAGAGRDLTFHQLDIRSSDVGELIIRRSPEVVWHLAAANTGDLVADAQVNIIGSLGLVDAARAAGARKVVITSSAAVYGSVPEGRAVTESDARAPSSPLAIAKHTVDSYLAATDAVVFTSLVLATVYGPRAAGGVVANWASCIQESRACTVFGDGNQVRDFVFVDDVVDALARAADAGDGMFLNVGTGKGTTLVELHRAMTTGELRQAAARPFDIRNSVVDPGRAAEHLGWKAWTPLATGLQATLAPPARD